MRGPQSGRQDELACGRSLVVDREQGIKQRPAVGGIGTEGAPVQETHGESQQSRSFETTDHVGDAATLVPILPCSRGIRLDPPVMQGH